MSDEEQQKEQLKSFLGEKEGVKAIKLLENFDKYVLKFKIDLNKLLEPHDLEVQVGMAVVDRPVVSTEKS